MVRYGSRDQPEELLGIHHPRKCSANKSPLLTGRSPATSTTIAQPDPAEGLKRSPTQKTFKMRKLNSTRALISFIFLSSTLSLIHASDIVIHRGRTITKGAGFGSGSVSYSPKLVEVYYADETRFSTFQAIDLTTKDPPMTVSEAASAIKKALQLDRIVPLKAELINYTWQTAIKKGNFLNGVFFWKMEVLTQRGMDEFLVLMDGTVVSPKLEPQQTLDKK